VLWLFSSRLFKVIPLNGKKDEKGNEYIGNKKLKHVL